MGKAVYSDYAGSAEYIRKRIGGITPDIAVILGSGLSGITEKVENTVVIPYSEIPHYPVSTVSYQKGEMVFGRLCGKNVLLMNGRFHYYEGWEMWQAAYPVGVFRLLGIRRAIITNAAGGIEGVRPGDVMLITDHIKLCAESPLRGPVIPGFGERFCDMQNVHDPEMAGIAEETARKNGFVLPRGVYAYMSGPQYETPAEIRMLRTVGANAVGMSTVPEIIFAAECGIKLLCLSCICNMAAGITGAPITEQEVLDTAALVSDRFIAVVCGVIEKI